MDPESGKIEVTGVVVVAVVAADREEGDMMITTTEEAAEVESTVVQSENLEVEEAVGMMTLEGGDELVVIPIDITTTEVDMEMVTEDQGF